VDARVRSAHAAARRELRPGVEALTAWLAIPSVSGSRAHEAEVWRAARWVARRLRGLTPDVRIADDGRGPVVLARVRAAAHRSGAPVLVVYGHLDVKPPGRGWTGDPWRARRIGPRLVARGASDDKGQLMAHLVALQAWAASGGLPGDVLVVVDGGEEVGSPGLEEALVGHRSGLLAGEAVTVLVSDTRAAGPGVPSLTVSQRGLLALEVSAHAGGPPVHAGRLGGAVLDPAVVLAGRLAQAARDVAALRSRCAARTDLRPGADLARAASGRVLHRDDLVARATTRGALTVTRWDVVGGPGAVPSRATASLDVRVPAGLPLAAAESVVRRSLAEGAPLRVEVRRTAATEGLCADLPAGLLEVVRRACREGYGVAPRIDASGGTIPALSVLGRIFRAPALLLGTGPFDDGAHGPDEYLHLGDWAKGVHTSVSLMHGLLRTSQARSSGQVIATSAARRLTHREYQPCHGPSGAQPVSVPEGTVPTSRT
jgi:succinyl-diaminopimelate desuccinylase